MAAPVGGMAAGTLRRPSGRHGRGDLAPPWWKGNGEGQVELDEEEEEVSSVRRIFQNASVLPR